MSATKKTENDRVKQILKDPEAFPDGAPALYGFVIGTHSKDELSYEEWAYPLKATGGQIALRWQHTGIPSHGGYILYSPSGLVYTFDMVETVYTGADAANCMKETMMNRDERITVVLRENADV